ncbi:MAG: c-type cytochrome [Candidatus Aminicenantes bacterium]|nr:c-type cytochrome [Candidatus Aminicenantes bacterium]
MKVSTRLLPYALCLVLFVAVGILLLLPVSAMSTPQESGRETYATGREVYMAACVNCHGPDGRGMPQSLVGFDQPLPDFSDCDFTLREPDADWWSIAHQGGPIRGFSDLMPAFGEALTEKELEQAIVYIRTFCTDHEWPRGELNLPRPLITEKAFPEDEAVINSVFNQDMDSITGEFVYEQRFGARNQLEFVVPFGWGKVPSSCDPGATTDWTSNLGDVAVAVKRALYHNWHHGSILSATAEIILPTGDEADGFGKGTFIFEPFITFGQVLPSDFFLHSQAGLELSANREKAENEVFFRLALGRSFTSGRFGRTWSPMIELLTSRELVSGESINLDVVPQVQVTLSKRQHIMCNLGVRIPVNKTAERDWQVLIYVLWDWFDGGFFEGW